MHAKKVVKMQDWSVIFYMNVVMKKIKENH